MTEKTILFRCGSAEVYEEYGTYFDAIYDTNFVVDYTSGVGLITFNDDTDIGMIDGEPLDILLQCLEHRLASRNQDEPIWERTEAMESLRNLRRWLSKLEDIQTADRERTTP